jgi:hypothetical protein
MNIGTIKSACENKPLLTMMALIGVLLVLSFVGAYFIELEGKWRFLFWVALPFLIPAYWAANSPKHTDNG